MQLKLKSVRCYNFRTMSDETLEVDDKTTVLVGANESGKTNLLDAIEFLNPEKELTQADTKINSEYQRKGHLPDIFYTFVVSDELRSKLKKYAKYFDKNAEVEVYRQGNDEDDMGVDPTGNKSFQYLDIYKNVSEVEQKPYLESGMTLTLAPGSWTTAKIPYRKNLQLFREKKIQKLEAKERDELAHEKVHELVFDALPQVFLWKYSDSHYIPKDVPIAFHAMKDQYPSVVNLFRLGGVEEDKIASHFTGRDSEYAHNFLNDLSRKVTKVINNTWKQRKNIKLTMHFKDAWIEILVEEKGYQIDPKKRSEGLQWYLTFLINFRSKLPTLKNTIILFDQPGDKLHPGGQKDLLERIEELSEQNQVIYSTHTPFMISKEYSERVRLIQRPDDDTKIVNRLSKREIFQDELLRNSLGFALSDIAPVSDKNILVEGLLDKAILLDLIEKLKGFKFSFNLNRAVFIPAHGASKILYYANILKSNGLDVITLFDNDTEGKNAIKENKKKKVLNNKEILSVSIKTGAETFEDLLPASLVEDAANSVGKQSKTGYKKLPGLKAPFMRQIVGHFTIEGITFDDETKHLLSIKIIDNFKKLAIDEALLKGELKELYDLIKILKRKVG